MAVRVVSEACNSFFFAFLKASLVKLKKVPVEFVFVVCTQSDSDI